MTAFEVPTVTQVRAEPSLDNFDVFWEVDGGLPHGDAGIFLLSLFVQVNGAPELQLGVEFAAEGSTSMFANELGIEIARTQIVQGTYDGRQITTSFPRAWLGQRSGAAQCCAVVSLNAIETSQRSEFEVHLLAR